jgi:hypothetical protein
MRDIEVKERLEEPRDREIHTEYPDEVVKLMAKPLSNLAKWHSNQHRHAYNVG